MTELLDFVLRVVGGITLALLVLAGVGQVAGVVKLAVVTKFSGTALDHITADPSQLGGAACVRNLHIPVSVIAVRIYSGDSDEEILSDYPDLIKEDIQQAVRFYRAATILRDEGNLP